jgi:sugar-specific transcriptional regulator TrmB
MIKFMPLEEALRQFGLTEKEAKIYLALLELGVASVQKIAQKANVARPTAYDILESLKNQQLASIFEKKQVKYYSPTDPARILAMAKEKTAMLENIFPQLRALYSLPMEKPKIRFYEGTEGMKIILEEILKEGKGIYCLGSAEDIFGTLDYFPEFVKKRVELALPAQVILRESKKAQERKKLGPKELREVRMIPAKYQFQALMIIFGHKIAMFSFKKDYIALLIESQALAEMQKASFRLIWEKVAK